MSDGSPRIAGSGEHTHKKSIVLLVLALKNIETRRFFPLPPRPSSNDGGLTSTHNPPTVDAPLVGAILDWWRVALPKRNLFPPTPPALFAEENDIAQAIVSDHLDTFAQSTDSTRETTHDINLQRPKPRTAKATGLGGQREWLSGGDVLLSCAHHPRARRLRDLPDPLQRQLHASVGGSEREWGLGDRAAPGRQRERQNADYVLAVEHARVGDVLKNGGIGPDEADLAKIRNQCRVSGND
jgi:hypothetical protein